MVFVFLFAFVIVFLFVSVIVHPGLTVRRKSVVGKENRGSGVVLVSPSVIYASPWRNNNGIKTGETEIGLKQRDREDQTTTENTKLSPFSADMQQYEEKDKTILPPHIGVK